MTQNMTPAPLSIHKISQTQNEKKKEKKNEIE